MYDSCLYIDNNSMFNEIKWFDMKFNKCKVRSSFLRLVDDCNKCHDKETIKLNIITEAKWLGFNIKLKRTDWI